MANKGNEIGRLDVFGCNNALKDGFKWGSLLYKYVFGYFNDSYNKKYEKSSMPINHLHIKCNI